jgi:ubiquinone/menaquinone biosynthesis C-methylase UbiE
VRPEATKALYDTGSLNYDNIYKGFIGRYVADVEKRLVLNSLEIKHSDLILDAGTGTGEYALEIAARGATVIGIDISEKMLRVAQQKDGNGRVNLLLAEAGHLPFRTKFKSIVGVGLIEYINNEDLLELISYTEEGGTAIFTGVLNKYSPWRLVLKKWMKSRGLPYKAVTKRDFNLNNKTAVEDCQRYFIVPPSFLKLASRISGSKWERALCHFARLLERTPLRFFGTNVLVRIRKL